MLVQFTLWVGKTKQGIKVDIFSTVVILYTISQELMYTIFCFYTYTLYSLILHLKSKTGSKDKKVLEWFYPIVKFYSRQ